MTTAYEWGRSLSALTCEHARSQLKKLRNKYASLDLVGYPVGKKGKRVYVCDKCFKPIGLLLTLYRAECECGELFSSPWEDRCEKCHRIEFTEFTLEAGVLTATPHEDTPTYWSWGWLSERLAEGLLIAPKRQAKA